MNNYRSEVRSKHARAVAEYHVMMSQGAHRQVGYWAIVVHNDESTERLGRAFTEDAAWEVAAKADRMGSLLATIDQ